MRREDREDHAGYARQLAMRQTVQGQPSFTAVPEALTISMLLPTDS